MRGVTDGRLPLDAAVTRHLELCLDCRACESACPSGVQYGKLIEPFRIEMRKSGRAPERLGWLQRLLLYRVTPYASRMRLALAPARLLQRTGIDGLLSRLGVFRMLPRSFRNLHDMVPPLGRAHGRLPETGAGGGFTAGPGRALHGVKPATRSIPRRR